MKYFEKLNYIQSNHMKNWLEERSVQLDKLSDACSVYCVCGRLCTGLHESQCKKFNDLVNRNTLINLKHLIPNNKSEFRKKEGE